MKTYSYFPRPNTIIIETSHAWSDQYEHLDLPRGNLHAILKNSAVSYTHLTLPTNREV